MQATVHGVSKSQTQLSDFTFFPSFLNNQGFTFIRKQTMVSEFTFRADLRFLESRRGNQNLTVIWLDGKCCVQFSRSVMSNSLQPHGLQHTRLPCPSATPGAYTNSTPSSQWCHQTISSLFVNFSCLQPFLTSGSFQTSQFFPLDGQSIGISALASDLPTNIQDWLHLGLTGWISLQSKELSRAFPNTTVQKHQFFSAQLSLYSNSHIHAWLLEKPQLWLDRPLFSDF